MVTKSKKLINVVEKRNLLIVVLLERMNTNQQNTVHSLSEERQ